jgi:hypothetical protein
MFDSYSDIISAISSIKTLSRSLFYRIAALLTTDEAQLRTSTNFTTRFLVNDTFGILKRIAAGVRPASVTGAFSEEMEFVRDYLEYGFDTKLKGDGTADSCVLHSVEFGLLAQSSSASAKLCDDCKRIFHLFDNMSIVLRYHGTTPETLMVIAECASKVKLILGHCVRVATRCALHHIHAKSGWVDHRWERLRDTDSSRYRTQARK